MDSVPGILTAAHVVEYIEKEAKKHATPNPGTILDRRLSLPIQEPLTHFQWFSTLRKERNGARFGSHSYSETKQTVLKPKSGRCVRNDIASQIPERLFCV